MTARIIHLSAHRPGNVVPLRPRTVGYDPFGKAYQEGLARALKTIAGEQAADARDGGKPSDSE